MSDSSLNTYLPDDGSESVFCSADSSTGYNLDYPEGREDLVGRLDYEKEVSFVERMKQARERRRRKQQKVNSTHLQEEIKKVTQSQSQIVQKFEEFRRSRLQSSDSNAPSGFFSKRLSYGLSQATRTHYESQKRLTRIPSCSKINDRQLVMPGSSEHSPSKIPKRQMLKSLHCMVKAKARIRENIFNYERPSDIINHARKMEKMTRSKEAELKSVPPLTSKAMQMENHINNSLIGSIKAKMSLLNRSKA